MRDVDTVTDTVTDTTDMITKLNNEKSNTRDAFVGLILVYLLRCIMPDIRCSILRCSKAVDSVRDKKTNNKGRENWTGPATW